MKILLIDENSSETLKILEQLRPLSRYIKVASIASEVDSILNTFSPDIIIIDMDNDEFNKLELQELNKQNENCYKIALLNERDQVCIENVLNMGINDILIRPISISLLKSKVGFFLHVIDLQDKLNGIIDNVLDGIVCIDEKGLVSSFNHAAERIFGYAENEIIGSNVNILMPSYYSVDHDKYISRYLETRTSRVIGVERKVHGLRRSGEVFSMRLSVSEARRNEKSQFIAVIQDISVEDEYRNRLEFLANHDDLTKLPNRLRFNVELELAIENVGSSLDVLLYIDLDGFKSVNDNLGHSSGDEVLSISAERMRHAVKPRDFIARLGGDEFAVICYDVKSEIIAEQIASRIISTLSETMQVKAGECSIGASIGLLKINSTDKAENILIEADGLMYEAKKIGGSTFFNKKKIYETFDK